MANCAEGYVELYPESGLNEFAHVLCLKATKIVSTGMGNVAELDEDDLQPGDSIIGYDLDRTWILICGALVFQMQLGFAVLEAGAISKKNTVNILFKNLLDFAIGAILFYLVGYAFAFGDTAGGFIGTTGFALDGITDFHSFFFQFAFACTAATIVSGSVAERTKLSAYFIYSAVITAFIYPVVVHQFWGNGWFTAWGAANTPLLTGTSASNGVIDFAGSGVVHLTGGMAGLMGAIVVGPRKDRFEINEDGTLGAVKDMPGHSSVLVSFGVAILWFCWYFFNAGSTLCAYTCMDLAAKCCVTTTLAASAAAVTGVTFKKGTNGIWDLDTGLNCVLAGLVSITAGCSVISPGWSILVGVIGAFFYILGDYLLIKFKIDDPLNASVIHGLCGIWGLLAVGIFATDENVAYAAYPNAGNTALASGEQFLVQLLGALFICAWVGFTSFIVFFGISKTIGMRVTSEIELEGLDKSEHGSESYKITKASELIVE